MSEWSVEGSEWSVEVSERSVEGSTVSEGTEVLEGSMVHRRVPSVGRVRRRVQSF